MIHVNVHPITLVDVMKTFKQFSEEPCCDDCYDHQLQEAEYQGRKVTLNNPTRSNDGKKKFYVYVKSKKGNVKKVSFGDTGLSVKLKQRGARASFAARHKCAQKKDKTKAGYWSCNIGRYWKSLGGGSNFSGYW